MAIAQASHAISKVVPLIVLEYVYLVFSLSQPDEVLPARLLLGGITRTYGPIEVRWFPDGMLSHVILVIFSL